MSSKGTTIKEALAKWKEENEQNPSEASNVNLRSQYPPIEKMDASLSTLLNCEQLSLSTNAIEKIANLNGLKNLKILCLARNNIKSLTGLEAVGDSLEELWISYNMIEKLKGINVVKKLKVLYMANNQVKEWGEFQKLADLPLLQELLLIGNPLEEAATQALTWRDDVARKLPKLSKLDGFPVIRDDA